MWLLNQDLWYAIRDLLYYTNYLGTGSVLWDHIFKDKRWLDSALQFRRCSPVLLGYGISSYRANKSSNNLYLALIAHDYSGDIVYEQKNFFAALQDGWVYNKDRYEVSLPSGITLNIYDIITGDDKTVLPFERIFTNKRGGIHSEYCHFVDKRIKVLKPTDILGRSAGEGYFDQPAVKGKLIEHGCKVKLLDGRQEEIWYLERRDKDRYMPNTWGIVKRNKIRWGSSR